MKLLIACECGNLFIVSVENGKYVQLRDNLEAQQFHYDGATISDNVLKEIGISCNRCRNHISIGVD